MFVVLIRTYKYILNINSFLLNFGLTFKSHLRFGADMGTSLRDLAKFGQPSLIVMLSEQFLFKWDGIPVS